MVLSNIQGIVGVQGQMTQASESLIRVLICNSKTLIFHCSNDAIIHVIMHHSETTNVKDVKLCIQMEQLTHYKEHNIHHLSMWGRILCGLPRYIIGKVPCNIEYF